MHTTFMAEVRPLNLEELLKHITNQYSEHLDKIGNRDDLMPAGALEDKDTVWLIGLPNAVVQEVFSDFLKEKHMPHTITANRIRLDKEHFGVAKLTTIDQGDLLFKLHKKLKQLETTQTHPSAGI